MTGVGGLVYFFSKEVFSNRFRVVVISDRRIAWIFLSKHSCMNLINSFYKIVAKQIQFFRMKRAKVMDMQVKDFKNDISN